MDPISLLHARPKGWLATSVLAPHAAAFATYLTHARYSSQSCGSYVASLAHLGRWMSQCCLPLGQLDEAAVEPFLDRHLPRCDCPRPVMRTHSTLRAACTHLLKVLREQRVIAERAGASGPIAKELDRYDAHLREARGSARGHAAAPCVWYSACCGISSPTERWCSHSCSPRTCASSSPRSWIFAARLPTPRR
jgi:hypothetical protein